MMLLVIVQLRLGSGKPVKPVNVLGVDAVEDAPRMPTGSGPAPPHWPPPAVGPEPSAAPGRCSSQGEGLLSGRRAVLARPRFT